MKYIKTILLTFFFFFITFLIIYFLFLKFTEDRIYVIIEKKEEVTYYHNNKKKTKKRLIHTNKGIFQVSDEILYPENDPSDIYKNLEEGKTYRITVVGSRLSFLSIYKNIVDYEKQR